MENSKDDIKRLPVIFTVIHLVCEEILKKLKTFNLNQTPNFHFQVMSYVGALEQKENL